MSGIEDVVKRLEAAAQITGWPWTWQQIPRDIRALLDAYREATEGKRPHSKPCTAERELDAARAEVDALKAENARLNKEAEEWEPPPPTWPGLATGLSCWRGC